jgi:hypothetical protein
MRNQHEPGGIQIEDAAPAIMDRHLAHIIVTIMVGGGTTGLRRVIDGIPVIISRQILHYGAGRLWV